MRVSSKLIVLCCALCAAGRVLEGVANYNIYVFKDGNEWMVFKGKAGVIWVYDLEGAKVKETLSDNIPTYEKLLVLSLKIINKPTKYDLKPISINTVKEMYAEIAGPFSSMKTEEILFDKSLGDGRPPIEIIREALAKYDEKLEKEMLNFAHTLRDLSATAKEV